MTFDQMHPEDVKAEIRKKYGSIKAFVQAKGLPQTSVSDLFRGRTSARVKDAVEEVLAEKRRKSIVMDRSSRAA